MQDNPAQGGRQLTTVLCELNGTAARPCTFDLHCDAIDLGPHDPPIPGSSRFSLVTKTTPGEFMTGDLVDVTVYVAANQVVTGKALVTDLSYTGSGDTYVTILEAMALFTVTDGR